MWLYETSQPVKLLSLRKPCALKDTYSKFWVSSWLKSSNPRFTTVILTFALSKNEEDIVDFLFH